jgi:hypothetical protein
LTITRGETTLPTRFVLTFEACIFDWPREFNLREGRLIKICPIAGSTSKVTRVALHVLIQRAQDFRGPKHHLLIRPFPIDGVATTHEIKLPLNFRWFSVSSTYRKASTSD